MCDETIEIPFCECGCGRRVKFNRKKKVFNKRLAGHSGGARKKYQEVPCKKCGKLIYPIWSSGRKRNYCDRKCYLDSRRPYDKQARQFEWWVKNRYGMTVEEYEKMFAAQGWGCAICGRKTHGQNKYRLHIDHNHQTGKVRGILCASCNRGLGYFLEDAGRLSRAAEYIKKSERVNPSDEGEKISGDFEY